MALAAWQQGNVQSTDGTMSAPETRWRQPRFVQLLIQAVPAVFRRAFSLRQRLAAAIAIIGSIHAVQISIVLSLKFQYIGNVNVDHVIAGRVRKLRKVRGLGLEALAELSGVSRSMISLIERGETSPTAAVLNKLADAFGVTLASLFADEHGSAPDPLSRLKDQHVWKDPASGYVRRHVSPRGYASPIEVVEVLFPPGETVTFENMVRNVVTHQQVWLLEGEMIVSVDDDASHLFPGDCLAMVLGQRIAFHNPTKKPARYAVILTAVNGNPRRQG